MASYVEDDTLTWKWVAVKYSEDRNAKRFTGQIIKSDVNYVKYLKSTVFDKYVWPEIYDIDTMPKSKIIEILNRTNHKWIEGQHLHSNFKKHLGYTSSSLYTVLGFICSCFPMLLHL